ncbi:MAG: hypothetical protein QMD12_02110 [Candidatus Aenigmarchaeota archaeon]|nr:hypothetical protein [Candidatus Aenigmarchaeota archaeon]
MDYKWKCGKLILHKNGNPHPYDFCDGTVIPTDEKRWDWRLYKCNKCGGERWKQD